MFDEGFHEILLYFLLFMSGSVQWSRALFMRRHQDWQEDSGVVCECMVCMVCVQARAEYGVVAGDGGTELPVSGESPD